MKQQISFSTGIRSVALLFVVSLFITALALTGEVRAKPPFQEPPPDGASGEETPPPEEETPPPPSEEEEPPPPTPVEVVVIEEPPPDEGSGDSGFIFDEAEFIDVVVVSGAYIWLCCGVGLFLLVPMLFLILHIHGRSKMNKEETI
jgi:hypothetical protein